MVSNMSTSNQTKSNRLSIAFAATSDFPARKMGSCISSLIICLLVIFILHRENASFFSGHHCFHVINNKVLCFFRKIYHRGFSAVIFSDFPDKPYRLTLCRRKALSLSVRPFLPFNHPDIV